MQFVSPRAVYIHVYSYLTKISPKFNVSKMVHENINGKKKGFSLLNCQEFPLCCLSISYATKFALHFSLHDRNYY